MMEEEYNKIKEAEKRRLCAKKRLKQLQQTSKRSSDTASLVAKMKQAGASLLRDTRSLVDKLSADVARSQARLEVALDDVEGLDETDVDETDVDEADAAESRRTGAGADSLRRYEEAQREARADAIVRQMRASTQAARSASSRTPRLDDAEETADPAASMGKPTSSTKSSQNEDAPSEETADDLPDKTIGRMGRP
jgi:hypothetical protein